MLHTNYAWFTNRRIIKLVTKKWRHWRHTRSSFQRSSTDICLAKADRRRRRRGNVKGKRTIYEIKALRHCDLHRLFGQKLHHNWEGREESFAALLLTTRFEHLMFARLNCYRIPEIYFVPPVFFFIRKRSTVQNGPFCKLIFSGMRLRLVLTLEQATNRNVLSGLFRCYSNYLILTCSPITGLHPDS